MHSTHFVCYTIEHLASVPMDRKVPGITQSNWGEFTGDLPRKVPTGSLRVKYKYYTLAVIFAVRISARDGEEGRNRDGSSKRKGGSWG